MARRVPEPPASDWEPMSELHELSALTLRDALVRGAVSAREVTEHFLRRIDTLDPDLGSFVTVTHDDALRAADHADRLRASGVALGPLHGVPLAHKDLTDVAGVRTTLGTAALDHAVAEQDAPLASVLRRAGAISLGKTQVPEFGLSCYSENRIAPPARNPLDRRLSPAGSSGGSAAAVAAGMVPFAPGTDGVPSASRRRRPGWWASSRTAAACRRARDRRTSASSSSPARSPARPWTPG
jgi:Asp-tRNA(Asn)/Glu-tRNA(Gln) amidotransferase A subunit family amidase